MIVWLVVVLATALIAQPMPAGAASRSLSSLVGLTMKGIVIGKTRDALTVAEGNRTSLVAVTAATQVVGSRTSFDQIAPHDLVRVDGQTTMDRRFVAARIEVLLAARNTSTARPRSATPAGTVLSWILNGGITVPLP